MDVLVALGTDASYAYSIISVLTHRFMHHERSQYSPTDFFETSAMLITFILLGRYLETSAKGKTSEAITKLVQLMPDTANLVALGKGNEVVHEEEIEAPLVQKGDYLKVRKNSCSLSRVLNLFRFIQVAGFQQMEMLSLAVRMWMSP